jgi:SAM-dependent methyltransferase
LECGAKFPVINNIPRFVPAEDYAGSFGMQWKTHRKTQLDSYTGLPLSRNRLYQATGWGTDLAGQTVLEVGSGAGRFTEVLVTTGAKILSFDLSAAVDANYANNGRHGNLSIFQADIRNIPVAEESMDKVLCLGVIQHTPDPEATFCELSKYVRPGGQLVIDVYPARLRSLISWKYLLRPITKRMDREQLYSLVSQSTPKLIPLSAVLYRFLGKIGPRMLPILQYNHFGLSPELNREWAILDTFDMYSPTYDRPQTRHTVKRWFTEVNFVDVSVEYGSIGIIGRGRRPVKLGI